MKKMTPVQMKKMTPVQMKTRSQCDIDGDKLIVRIYSEISIADVIKAHKQGQRTLLVQSAVPISDTIKAAKTPQNMH